MKGSIYSRLARASIAAIAAAALLAPASQGANTENGPPEIESTSFRASEDGLGVVIGAATKGASSVTVTIGNKSNRQRVQLSRIGRRGKSTEWSVAAPEREDRCAPVKFLAKGSAGSDERQATTCVFGPNKPPETPVVGAIG